MKKLIPFIALLLFITLCRAQSLKKTQPFGKVDTADLRLTDCDFEKGAGAEILFDKATIYACIDSVVMTRHKRIKIFNDNGKNQANIRLSYYSYIHFEDIPYIHAQTINLENNKIVITPVDPKLIYTEKTDKYNKTMAFAFPEVKAGSIIEYEYEWRTVSPGNIPNWLFQDYIPTAYSELTATITDQVTYNIIKRGYQAFTTNKIDTLAIDGKPAKTYYWAKEKTPSIVDEPFITVGNFNLQLLRFQLQGVRNSDTTFPVINNTWSKIALSMVNDEDFGGHLNQYISKQDTLLAKVKPIRNVDQKIAYLFNDVKRNIKWNGINRWYIDNDLGSVWSKKTGSSTEINLELYNLLRRAGIKAYTMAVNTREDGLITPLYAGFSQINKIVVFIPIDTSRYYVLDASNKYNVYNEVPNNLLNTYGMRIGVNGKIVDYQLIKLKNELPALQVVEINADISPNSKVTGTTVMSNYSYFRYKYNAMYDHLGLDKFIVALRGNDNRLKIDSLSFDNMQVDSLPLIQKFKFDLTLTGSDDDYIYFNPNLFTPLQTNPFLGEHRISDIDFGNNAIYNITGRYKIPKNYKVEGLPKPVVLNLNDKSISFRRRIGEADGFIELNYTITYKRAVFGVDEYDMLREFYKKMFELLNEPIVLKKGS